MDIPLDNPLLQFLFWLLHTPGVGGFAVLLVGGGSILAYALTLFWIRAGGEIEEAETFAYPTSTLIHPHEPES